MDWWHSLDNSASGAIGRVVALYLISLGKHPGALQ